MTPPVNGVRGPPAPAASRGRASGLLLCLALPLAVAGCGFQPLYGGTQASEVAAASLPSIYVDILPNRTGQELRQALQARLEGSAGGQNKQYELAVAYSIQQEGIGVQPDNSVTRTRFIGRASWFLKTLRGEVVASGNARTLDGVDDLDEQPFEVQLASEKTEARIAGNVADQVTAQIQSYFLRRGERASRS